MPPIKLDPERVTPFAETNFRGQRRRFGIKLDDRRRHMYVIGKTGMGKSTLLENMIISDIREGYGIAVVDPHGDLVEKIMDYIPSRRINDVVYFNPADIDNPIAFNALESVDPTHRHLVASGLVGVFKKIWADSWGPRLEYVLRNTILSLLEYPGSTILGITRLLIDAKYRKKVVAKINDPILKTFWIDEYGSYSNQFRVDAISPIQNKVGQFLSSSIIRNIVGQTKSSIDMREVMDSGKILLMNLSKGRIGEDNSKLLGAMMITKLQLAAMSRVDIPEDERTDFVLYVDEFQNFATESFANILSEARKYHLDLVIGHQYVEQLDEIVQAAVFGNVGTLVCFRVGATDAELLEKEFEPVFMATDLVNLAKYEMYLKLMINGMASEPFSARGLPPIQFEKGEGNRDKIINVSRERYATPREVVENKIMRWSGLSEEEDSDSEPSAPRPAVGNDREARPPAKPDSARSERPAPRPSGLKINLAEPVAEVAEPAEQAKPAERREAAPEPAISLHEAMSKPPIPFKGGNRAEPQHHQTLAARPNQPPRPRNHDSRWPCESRPRRDDHRPATEPNVSKDRQPIKQATVPSKSAPAPTKTDVHKTLRPGQAVHF